MTLFKWMTALILYSYLLQSFLSSLIHHWKNQKLSIYLYFSVNGETSFWNADGSWTVGPFLPYFTHSHCAVQLDETTTFIIGGYNNLTQLFYSSVFAYSWVSQSWTKKADLQVARASMTVKTELPLSIDVCIPCIEMYFERD
jgi:hypothetical protein